MKNTLILLILSSVLAGCANIPKQVALTPDVKVASYQYDSQLRVSLTTVDERLNHYLISVSDNDKEAATLVASGSNIRQQLQEELSNGFAQQKLNQVTLSPVAIKTTLLRCSADVTQNNFSYEGTSSVQIKVVITTPKGDIAKLFKSEQKMEDAFSADLAKIQRNLNDQLSRTIEQILADEELRATIEKSMDAPVTLNSMNQETIK